MKVTLAVIFSVTYLAAVLALPATREPKDEVEFVPLEDQNGGGPIVDTGVIGVPFGPFDGLFESLAGMMARMRQQMDYLLRRLPIGNRTIEDSPFPGFPNIADLDLGKGNTTSVTKVIDGHKVVINETEYKQEGPNSGAFFKVRIIDVLPDSNSDEMTTDKNAEEFTPQTKDTESVEDSFENEIPKNREVFNNIETFDEPDNSHLSRKITTGTTSEDRSVESLEDASVKSFTPFHQAHSYHPFQKLTEGSSKWSSPESFSTEEDNSIESAYRPPDLSRDTFVNHLMADAGAPTNPNAEVFSDVEFNVPYAMAPRQPFEKITNPR